MRGGGGGAGKSMVEQQFDVEENPAFWKDHNVQVGERVDVLRLCLLPCPCGGHIVIGMSIH